MARGPSSIADEAAPEAASPEPLVDYAFKMTDPVSPSDIPAAGQDASRGAQPALARAVWSTRLVVLVAVLGSAVASLVVFYLATTDAIYLVLHLRPYTDPSLDAASRKMLHGETIVHVVEIVDGYLLAMFLLVFAVGFFGLFVIPLEPAGVSRTRANPFVVRDLDDLKDRLGKVILIIMIVTFFEEVLTVAPRSAIELLWVAAGIALVGVTLWLSHSDAGRG